MVELTKSMEQYLEIIYMLQQKWGAASVTDIAEERGVKSPSVTYVLRKLKALDLINYKRYRSVSLTPKGMKMAENLERTHESLRWFLVMIGVDSVIADEDACEIEHIIRPETVEKITEFVNWVKQYPEDPKWLEQFHKYQKSN